MSIKQVYLESGTMVLNHLIIPTQEDLMSSMDLRLDIGVIIFLPFLKEIAKLLGEKVT